MPLRGPSQVEDLKTNLRNNKIDISDTSVINAYYNRHSTLALVNNMPDSLKKSVRWYIDCGDDDFLYEGNCLVHIAMKKKEIPHEFRIRDGCSFMGILENSASRGTWIRIDGISSVLRHYSPRIPAFRSDDFPIRMIQRHNIRPPYCSSCPLL